MLQQTRVDQATPYFERFIARFPTISSLADADQQEVLKFWEGLGYYSRARNLHNGAKQVMALFGGKLPHTWEEIKSIKGIGDYTASAILSIAFNQAFGVLDGNVIRVLSRYLNHSGDVTKPSTRVELQQVSNEIISQVRPGDFNQALMELGARICTPRKPDCRSCPIQHTCISANSLNVENLPYKPRKKKIPHHQIVVGVIIDTKTNHILISKRRQDVMLGGLWEFPGGKVHENESLSQALIREITEETGIQVRILKELSTVKHAYSHFKITLTAFACEYINGIANPRESDEIRWISIHEIDGFPFPRANLKFLHNIKDYFNNSFLR